MSRILFRGKYVKPLIELLDRNGKHLLLVSFYDGSSSLMIRDNNPLLDAHEYSQVVITKKDYKRLLVLLNIMDNPLEAFKSIYYKD